MSFSGELLVLICGIVALVSAIGTVALRTPLRAAMSLLLHILSLAGLYLTLNAQLLAAIQLLVYAGAVVVLFVFVIMLIGPSAVGSPPDQRGLLTKTVGAAVLAMTMGTIAFGVAAAGNEVPRPVLAETPGGEAFGSVEAMAQSVYVDAMIPFELVSMLLLVAIIAAIAVARGATSAEKGAIDKTALPVRPTVLDPPKGIDSKPEAAEAAE